jgi:hypothetical protein
LNLEVVELETEIKKLHKAEPTVTTMPASSPPHRTGSGPSTP